MHTKNVQGEKYGRIVLDYSVKDFLELSHT